MQKKCLSCGAPLAGFFAKIAAFVGVKPSAKNPDYCNKCEDKIPSKTSETSETSATTEPVKQEEVVTKKPASDISEDAGKKTDEQPK